MRIIFFNILIIMPLLAGSCQLDLDFSLDASPKRVTVNSILTPDSTINVEMYWSSAMPNEEGEFSPIETAELSVYENGDFLGTLANKGKGNYALLYYPKAGRRYDLVAEISGHPPLKASTTVPQLIDIQACYANEFVRRPSLAVTSLQWKDGKDSGEVYWLALQGRTYASESGACSNDSTQNLKHFLVHGLRTSSPYVDTFNGALSEGQFEFDYMRIPDAAFNEQEIKLKLWSFHNCVYPFYSKLQKMSLDPERYLKAHVMNVSPEYDAYLKTTYTNFLNDKIEGKNLFFDTAPIFNNIENGIGIFGSYTSSQKAIQNSLCK